MVILFSSMVSSTHQQRLQSNFPNETFIFCENMSEAQKHLPRTDVLVTYGVDLTSELLEQARQLKWIAVLSAGMEEMPLKTIENKQILVTNSRGIHKVPMSEYVISMLLQVFRQEKEIIKNEMNHIWDKSVHVREITGKTMLVVGAGSIGQEIARLGKAFRMTTYGISKSGKPIDFFDENYSVNEIDDLLPVADFVISVLPSTAETKKFFKVKQFQQMNENAIFINIGRGDAVDENDLLQSMQQNEIAHAVLDVFEEEPLAKNHPFWEEDNITVTSHISGVSSMYVSRALEIFEKNLQRYLEGHAYYENEVNPSKGY